MKKIEIIKRCVFLFFIIIILMGVASMMLKYEVEGEKSLPYNLSKILVVSTVEGTQNDDGQNIFNINVKQANDLYFYIDKSDSTDETIKQITLTNFDIKKSPQKGKMAIYRPTGDINDLYTYSEQNYLDNSLTYTGSTIDDLKTLEISNTGGVIGCRISLDDLGIFVSNETTEIVYDGTLLQNLGITVEDISFNISFYIQIETSENVTYQGTISLELPAQDLIEKGSSNFEITDFSDVVFKRV